jgi:predicted amidohydrolase YtcJ
MTHEYTILTGGRVLPAGAADDAGEGGRSGVATAIAWAAGTVLATGPDAAVLAISRGDSHFGELRGGVVVPLGGPLEPGAPADFAVLDRLPGAAGTPRILAVVRGGHLVEGELTGL